MEVFIKNFNSELCNVPIRYMMMVSETLDIPMEDLNFKFEGLNHFHWHRVWDKNGVERTSKIIETVYNPNSAKKLKGMQNIKNLGILPRLYHRYYYITDDMLKNELKEFQRGMIKKIPINLGSKIIKYLRIL